MAGFNWNEFYTVFKVKLERTVKCTVGRYVTPKESQFPYVDVALSDNSGGNYDLSGNEGSQNPLLVITAYDTGSLADSNCEKISAAAKVIMLSYGFQYRGGPVPVANAADPNICCWVGRYQRIFGNDEILTQLH